MLTFTLLSPALFWAVCFFDIGLAVVSPCSHTHTVSVPPPPFSLFTPSCVLFLLGSGLFNGFWGSKEQKRQCPHTTLNAKPKEHFKATRQDKQRKATRKSYPRCLSPQHMMVLKGGGAGTNAKCPCQATPKKQSRKAKVAPCQPRSA